MTITTSQDSVLSNEQGFRGVISESFDFSKFFGIEKDFKEININDYKEAYAKAEAHILSGKATKYEKMFFKLVFKPNFKAFTQ